MMLASPRTSESAKLSWSAVHARHTKVAGDAAERRALPGPERHEVGEQHRESYATDVAVGEQADDDQHQHDVEHGGRESIQKRRARHQGKADTGNGRRRRVRRRRLHWRLRVSSRRGGRLK